MLRITSKARRTRIGKPLFRQSEKVDGHARAAVSQGSSERFPSFSSSHSILWNSGNLSLEAENRALADRVLNMAAEALRSSDVQYPGLRWQPTGGGGKMTQRGTSGGGWPPPRVRGWRRGATNRSVTVIWVGITPNHSDEERGVHRGLGRSPRRMGSGARSSRRGKSFPRDPPLASRGILTLQS